MLYYSRVSGCKPESITSHRPVRYALCTPVYCLASVADRRMSQWAVPGRPRVALLWQTTSSTAWRPRCTGADMFWSCPSRPASSCWTDPNLHRCCPRGFSVFWSIKAASCCLVLPSVSASSSFTAHQIVSHRIVPPPIHHDVSQQGESSTSTHLP